MKIVKLFLIGVFSIILAGNVSLAETIPFDSDKWEIKAKENTKKRLFTAIWLRPKAAL